MSMIYRFRKNVLAVLTTVGLVALVVSVGFATDASSAEAPKPSCGEVLQLPEGSTVEDGGDRLLVHVPPGYALAHDGVAPHFVAMDPDTVMPAPVGPDGEFLVFGVDCDCQGSGGCTEVFQIEQGQIYCDRFDGCPDCEMTVN